MNYRTGLASGYSQEGTSSLQQHPFQPDFVFPVGPVSQGQPPYPYHHHVPLTAPQHHQDIGTNAEYFLPPPLQGSLLEDDQNGKQASFLCTKLSIGNWLLSGSIKPPQDTTNGFSIEMKWLLGRKKIVYQIFQPEHNKFLILEYDFAQICGLQFKDTTPCMMIVELTDPPVFATKDDKGKLTRVIDFTQGNATYYKRHYIELISGNFSTQIEQLMISDSRIKKLVATSLIGAQATFLPQSNVCDWDKETSAVLQCTDCSAKYCEECDEVLHRHPTKKQHIRTQITEASTQNTDKGSIKKRKKRKKGDKCRCGTGATKGTLGEPCTGNRCPCFSERRNCVSCGCKNCNNPYNHKQNGTTSDGSDGAVETSQNDVKG